MGQKRSMNKALLLDSSLGRVSVRLALGRTPGRMRGRQHINAFGAHTYTHTHQDCNLVGMCAFANRIICQATWQGCHVNLCCRSVLIGPKVTKLTPLATLGGSGWCATGVDLLSPMNLGTSTAVELSRKALHADSVALITRS